MINLLAQGVVDRMSRDIPSEEILAAMNNIDNHITDCLMAIHGIRHSLRVQTLVNSDNTTQTVLDHYYGVIINLSEQISQEIQRL